MTSGSNASKFPTVCSRFLKMKNAIESFCASEHLLVIDPFVFLLLHQVRFKVELRMEKGVIFTFVSIVLNLKFRFVLFSLLLDSSLFLDL
jgi:hypothetical protein